MATRTAQFIAARFLQRWLGIVVLAFLIGGWGQLDPLVVAGGAAAVVVWISFVAPTWCGAVTRHHELCRNNTAGALMGCHLRQHKWQKVKLAVVPRAWRALGEHLWRVDKLETLGLVIGLGTFLATAVQAASQVRKG